jgi:hypothetical protein
MSQIIEMTGTIQLSQVWLTLFIIIVVFPVPLGLIYMFSYHKSVSWWRAIILFSLTTGLGYIACLLFYRTMIMNDKEAKIDKMGREDAFFVFWNTLASFVIVAITMFGLGTNPGLISIFENTIGYWFIHIWGLDSLMKEIVKSNIFDKIDVKDFNYNFLITQIDVNNLQEIINSSSSSSKTTSPTSKYPIDFRIEFDSDSGKQSKQKKLLESLVFTKNTVGHYVWVYLSSIVSILVSILACSM